MGKKFFVNLDVSALLKEYLTTVVVSVFQSLSNFVSFLKLIWEVVGVEE
jgi:hypothetical protein